MRNKTSKIFYSLFFPALFVILLWTIKSIEIGTGSSFAIYGIYPRTVHGLIGVLAGPLLHADFDHLLSNTIPLVILGSVMFYFYRTIAFQVFFWVYLMTGIWVWAAARESYHIGASGILYGFVSFLFFSGVFRKDTRLLALSLFVVFLYGGTVWGIFPIRNGISWESHLLGALAGLITAYNFKKEGPAPRVYDFGSEEENELVDVSGEQTHEDYTDAEDPVVINYTIVTKNGEEVGPDDAPKQ
jgi:membrane associated rhomboid family serine protease